MLDRVYIWKEYDIFVGQYSVVCDLPMLPIYVVATDETNVNNNILKNIFTCKPCEESMHMHDLIRGKQNDRHEEFLEITANILEGRVVN